jgi:predicted signal transduction protein with EAL and GGDEF domain
MQGKGYRRRLGGDEFAVIMTNTASSEADRIMQRIKNDFREEKVIAIRGSISMGYGTKTDPDQDLAAVVLTGEEALYREKILFRKDIDSEMEDTIMETLHEKCPVKNSFPVDADAVRHDRGNPRTERNGDRKAKAAGLPS